eukprot:CAMPEP_0206034280 /NCGR_PEP_ID=MMETSP1466-20131121/1236_1 /ASSEMBLY_ACC=CAM_ASM_001126 /TAXON_ID=44452 /ORGANISM="Pavlova gyrans, Strain CCMP608" /LENGTH=330 /DNA_ID=CAMNT_0053408553 /DNA_START=60 /DNA_END=1049 /DNA_ORIENTATION=-
MTDIVPIKFNVSSMEYNSSNGTVREMLLEKGYRPFTEERRKPVNRKQKTYDLEEATLKRHVVRIPPVKTTATEGRRQRQRSRAEEEAEAIRERVQVKVEAIAKETRLTFQQRLQRVSTNGIFDEDTNKTRMQAMYKSALLERLNWDVLEREAELEVKAGIPSQSLGGAQGGLGVKLDKALQAKAPLPSVTQGKAYKRIMQRQSALHTNSALLTPPRTTPAGSIGSRQGVGHSEDAPRLSGRDALPVPEGTAPAGTSGWQRSGGHVGPRISKRDAVPLMEGLPSRGISFADSRQGGAGTFQSEASPAAQQLGPQRSVSSQSRQSAGRPPAR